MVKHQKGKSDTFSFTPKQPKSGVQKSTKKRVFNFVSKDDEEGDEPRVVEIIETVVEPQVGLVYENEIEMKEAPQSKGGGKKKSEPKSSPKKKAAEPKEKMAKGKGKGKKKAETKSEPKDKEPKKEPKKKGEGAKKATGKGKGKASGGVKKPSFKRTKELLDKMQEAETKAIHKAIREVHSEYKPKFKKLHG